MYISYMIFTHPYVDNLHTPSYTPRNPDLTPIKCGNSHRAEALRHVGLGLWLRDLAALKKVVVSIVVLVLVQIMWLLLL